MKPRDLKLTNRLNVLRSLYLRPRSRIELSRRLDLSKATISQIVDQLMDENLVFETGTADAGEFGGKKPTICAVNPDYGRILALHYDYSTYQIALADMGGRILAHATRGIVFRKDYRRTFDVMLSGIDAFLDKCGPEFGRGGILACGIASTGLVDSEKGVLQYAATQKSWRDVPLRAYFGERLGTPVFVDHDARVLTCVDRYAQRDGDGDIHAGIFVGSGVATGVAIGNAVIHGAHYGAVNFSHTVVQPDGPLCRCGKRGCWEALVSRESLARDVGARTGRKGLGFGQALLLYRRGDPDAVDVVENGFCRWMGMGISNFITIFNPLKLIVYGDDALFGPAVREKTLATVAAMSSNVAMKTEIVFDTDIGLVYMRGVIGMVLRRLLSPEGHGHLSAAPAGIS